MRLIFEGLDFTGKSTIINLLSSHLNDIQIEYSRYAFPRDMDEGVQKLLFGKNKINPFHPEYLILALYYKMIEMDYDNTTIQLIDRSFPSTFAYNAESPSEREKLKNFFLSLYKVNPIPFEFDYLFYLEIEEDTLKQRYFEREDIVDDYRQDIDLKVVKDYTLFSHRYQLTLDLYREIFGYERIITINTSTMTKEEVLEYILKKIGL